MVVLWCFLVQSICNYCFCNAIESVKRRGGSHEGVGREKNDAFWSSQSCWSLPPDIWLYLRRSGCHTFGMACRGDWLVSSLRFMATKASALCGALPSPPCCGCCSCALAAALRYLPSGDPESPLNTAKAVRAYLGLCCLLLPASAAFPGVRSFLFAGLRLPASPRALAVFGPCLVVLCPGRCFWPPLLCGFGLVGWRGLVFFAWVGWSGFPVWWWFRAVFCYVLAPRVCWLCPTLVWTGTFVYFAFTCTTKALIDHCTCVCPLTGQLHLYC